MKWFKKKELELKLENKCVCHVFILPRWDIYTCADCGRKLCGFEIPQYKGDQKMDKLFIPLILFTATIFIVTVLFLLSNLWK